MKRIGNRILKFAAVILIGAATVYLAVWIVARAGYPSWGFFRIMQVDGAALHCRVDMTGFEGFYLYVVGDDIMPLHGNLEVRSGHELLKSIELGKDPTFGEEEWLADKSKKEHAISISKFIVQRRGHGSPFEFSLRVESNTSPFEVWVGYAVRQLRLTFLDSKAESRRVEVIQ